MKTHEKTWKNMKTHKNTHKKHEITSRIVQNPCEKKRNCLFWHRIVYFQHGIVQKKLELYIFSSPARYFSTELYILAPICLQKNKNCLFQHGIVYFSTDFFLKNEELSILARKCCFLAPKPSFLALLGAKKVKNELGNKP